MKKVLSTSEVARMLGVAVGSVANWIDQGELKAGKTPGGHRRIQAADVVKFLKAHRLPIPEELGGSAPKVLIVDDEKAVAKLLALEIIEKYPDYDVRQANDGFAAGEIVGRWTPDVVILDLKMPGMDGYEVCRRIKANEETQDTVVIAITAEPSPSAEQRILEAGATVLLSKPLQEGLLIQHLEEAVAAVG